MGTRSTVLSKAVSGSHSPSTRSASAGQPAHRRPPCIMGASAVAHGRVAQARLAVRLWQVKQSALPSSTTHSASTIRTAQPRPAAIAIMLGRRSHSGRDLARMRRRAPASSSSARQAAAVSPCLPVLRRRIDPRAGTLLRQEHFPTRRPTPSLRQRLLVKCRPSRRRLAAVRPSRAGV